ncbi:MAG: chorismate mutase [Spirochaetia bacterium]|nr:chorismate mutase [Spirochaetia bacterium]
MKLQAVRGAVQIKDNTTNAIENGTQSMMRTLLDENYIEERHIVSVQFSITQDLTKLNPAAAFRQLGYPKTPLFCCQEPHIEASMPRVIRVLLTVYTEEGVLLRPCYLHGAEKLRPDLG